MARLARIGIENCYVLPSLNKVATTTKLLVELEQ